jgi:hypothetical protein
LPGFLAFSRCAEAVSVGIDANIAWCLIWKGVVAQQRRDRGRIVQQRLQETVEEAHVLGVLDDEPHLPVQARLVWQHYGRTLSGVSRFVAELIAPPVATVQ